ncbi:DUF1116 domain-containing protein [Oceanibaculum sp.]|uniref:oxamate carbamoyltransferase subunit AllG family protein n=1 Tax=Oceanibaculum sp. TaxID=1903597 RepID=UPI002590DC50|nr:DUF1116 domain-containing protein [Oceanibaculum sp.]MCH2393758.1 DUF1116 domain-containing protein [Oceanibaculum sp.]
MTGSSPATQESHARLLAVEPVLSRIAPLRDLVSDLPPATLFHAGPPFTPGRKLPAPVLNSVLAAIQHEGWADTTKEAQAALESGAISLAPAQDIGLVTPLAFVVGPSMYCLAVTDAANPKTMRLSPLNDGPLPDCLRFGTGRAAGLDLLRGLTGGIGADLAVNLKPSPLLPVLAAGLKGGDDLHGRVSAAQESVRGFFGPALSVESAAYLVKANQFVLNVIMAATALMIGAGAGVPGSSMVVASGGNGIDHGYKLASEPERWIIRPANRPIGPKMQESAEALPAIGDSAVIDAAGFGAACLRFAPDLAGLKGHVDDAYFTEAAHDAFIGPHPALPFPGLKLGLDLARSRACLGIMLGMVGASGTEGLVGRGVAPWPAG